MGVLMSELIKMDQEVFRSQLKELPRHKYTTEVFQLRDIPLVMRSRLGWHVAAALMERWFNGAAFAMPDDMKLVELRLYETKNSYATWKEEVEVYQGDIW